MVHLQLILALLIPSVYYVNCQRLKWCKCVCKMDELKCASNASPKCTDNCNKQCRSGEHTMHHSGVCLDDNNCTCFMTYEYNPVCARIKILLKEKTFYNIRQLHCHNACYEDSVEYVRDGRCKRRTSINDDLWA